MKCTIKRRGHEERFDERKVYASCYAACLSAGIKHIESEKICENVSKEVKKWVKEKECISSSQIFKKTSSLINKYDKKAAYMYKTHRDIN